MLDNLSSWISNATSYDVSKTDPNISGELSENVVDFLFDALQVKQSFIHIKEDQLFCIDGY